MTKEQMIYITVSALISAVAKFTLDHTLGPYMPDKKKLSSYIRKFFVFILRYVLPIATIIFLLFAKIPVDKSFIYAMIASFSVLTINICTDVINRRIDSVISLLKIMADYIDKDADSNHERFHKILDIQKQDLTLLGDVMALMNSKGKKKGAKP